jgi:hypothetical protein
MRSKIQLAATFSMAALLALPFLGCKQKPISVEGNTYEVQCIWYGGPTEYNIKVTFNSGNTLVHVDDTASLNGTWSSVEEVIVYTLTNPPKNTEFRGTFDKTGMAGNMRDAVGDSGIFYGALQ